MACFVGRALHGVSTGLLPLWFLPPPPALSQDDPPPTHPLTSRGTGPWLSSWHAPVLQTSPRGRAVVPTEGSQGSLGAGKPFLATWTLTSSFLRVFMVRSLEFRYLRFWIDQCFFPVSLLRSCFMKRNHTLCSFCSLPFACLIADGDSIDVKK